MQVVEGGMAAGIDTTTGCPFSILGRSPANLNSDATVSIGLLVCGVLVPSRQGF